MAGVPYHQVSNPAKLQALLDAVLVIESDLDLMSLLRQIVGSAATSSRPVTRPSACSIRPGTACRSLFT